MKLVKKKMQALFMLEVTRMIIKDIFGIKHRAKLLNNKNDPYLKYEYD